MPDFISPLQKLEEDSVVPQPLGPSAPSYTVEEASKLVESGQPAPPAEQIEGLPEPWTPPPREPSPPVTPLSQEDEYRLLNSGVDPSTVQTLKEDRDSLVQDQLREARQDYARELLKDSEVASVEQWQASKQAEDHQSILDHSEQVDPLEVFDDDTLAKEENFDPKVYAVNNPEVLQDNKKVARLAEIYRRRFMEPITGKDVAIGVWRLPGQAVKQIYHLGKGLSFALGDVFSAPLTGYIGGITGQDQAFFDELNRISEKDIASDYVGLTKGSYNFFSWAKGVPKRTLRRLGYDKWEDVPPERLQEEFRNDVAEFQQGEAIGRGEGEDFFGGRQVKSVIEENGSLDVGRVQALEQSDLAGFLAFSAAFHLTKATGKAAVGKTLEKTGARSAIAGGRELTRLRRAVAKLEESVPANSPALRYSKDLLKAAEADVGKVGRIVSQLDHVFGNAQRLTDARIRYQVALGAATRFATPEARAAAQAAEQSLRTVEQQVSGASRLVSQAKRVAGELTPQEIGKQVAGRTLQATGAAARGAGRVAGLVPPVVTYGFAAKQILAGNLFYAIGALGGAKALGINALGRAARTRLTNWGNGLSAVGRRVAQARPAAPAEKAILGLAQGSGELVAGALKGMPIDMGFALALAQTPEDVRNPPAFATAFGAIGALHRPAQRYIERLRVAPQEIADPGRAQRSAPGAPIRQGAKADRQGRRLLNEEGEARVNAIENFLETVGSDTPVYVMPSQGAFFEVLRQNFIRENGREPNAQETATLQQYSNQRGVFTEDIIGDNNQRGSAIFITSLEAAPHEGAHAFQSVLGESGNQIVDNIIFDRYANQWEQIGQQYVSQLTGASPSANWREALQRHIPRQIRDGVGGDPVAAADVYLAREIAAENFSTLFESTGGDPASRQGVFGDLANVVDKAARFLGVNLFEGFQTPGEIGVPPEGATLSAIQQQARRAAQASPGQARQTPPAPSPQERAPARPTRAQQPPRGVPPTPAQEPAAGEEARRIADQAPDTALPGATMTQREILGTMADAIARGEGVQTAYRSAPEAPGANVEAQRVERRAEIEAARNMPEDVRRMVFNTGFPYKIEVSRNGVTQVLQWSPDMLAANALRWSKRLSDLAKRDPNAPELRQLEDAGLVLDVQAGEWTAESWRKILQDATTFSENQRAGFTGSGQRLEVPAELRSSGIYGPPEEGAPIPLDRTSADFVNMLYNLRVPSTPRITGEVLPRNIVAQRISEATEPGRVVEPAVLEPGEIPVRRRGVPGAEVRERFGELAGRNLEITRQRAQALGIEGAPILEVNPLRASLEKALQRNDIRLPEGIEVVQRLNVEHIASTTPEPNLPRTAGGNVLTLTAGFLPQARPGNVVLYRGEEGTGAVSGAWWTRNPNKAAQFAAGGTVSAIEVPLAVAEAGKRAAERVGQGGDTYVLPAEIGRDAQAFRLEPPTFELDAQFLPPNRFRRLQQLREHNRQTKELDALLPENLLNEGFRIRPGTLASSFKAYREGEQVGSGSREGIQVDDIPQKSVIESALKQAVDKAVQTLGSSFEAQFLPREEGGFPPLTEAERQRLNAAIDRGLDFAETPDRRRQYLKETYPRRLGEKELDAATGQFLPKAREEALSAEEIAIANRTARAAGPVGVNPTKTTRAVLDRVDPNESVLDFGAGPAARQSEILREAGFRDVTSHEFGANVREGVHDPNALDRQYDTVFASNVLNVQSNNAMLNRTLGEIASTVSPGGRALFNYPKQPRKNPNLTPNQLQEQIKNHFDSVERVAGTTGEPVFEAKQPKQPGRELTEDFQFLPAKDTTQRHVRNAALRMEDGAIIEGQTHFMARLKADELGNKSGIADSGFVDSEGKFLTRDEAFDLARTTEQIPADLPQFPGLKPAQLESQAFQESRAFLPAKPKKPLKSPAEWQAMDKGAREEWFPEAIIPEIKTKRQKNKKGEYEEVEIHPKIPHEIVTSPRAKQFVDKDGKFNEEAAVQDFANELLKRYEPRRNEPEVQAGERWYEEFFPLLQAHYKGDAQALAELLAATSPNTPPRTNFYFADLALRQWKAGEFKDLISKYEEGLNLVSELEPVYGPKGGKVPREWTGRMREMYEAEVPEKKRPQKPSPASYFGWWMAKHDLLPRQRGRPGKGGKEIRPKFGFHGERILEVVTRQWMNKNAGPKTKNFVSNLTGEGVEATIDVWAARTMRELGWKGFVDRWRVLPINETGVSNPDFFFSQKVFRRAAEKLGILPRMIQGGMWFLEKIRWFEEGWGRLDLGDYKTELERIIKREREGKTEDEAPPEEPLGAEDIQSE